MPGLQCTALLAFAVHHAPAHQQRHDGGIDKHFCKIVFGCAHPEKMQQRQACHPVHRLVQCTPARPAQPLDGAVEGSGRQRREQQQRHKAHQNERALGDVAHHAAPVQPHVEPGIGQHVQRSIKEHKQPEHAAKACQGWRAGQHPQGRDGQHQAQTAQRPDAQRAHQRLGRVGAQRIQGSSADQPRKGQQCQRKHHRLGGAVHQQFFQCHREVKGLAGWRTGRLVGWRTGRQLPQVGSVGVQGPQGTALALVRRIFSGPCRRTAGPPALRSR